MQPRVTVRTLILISLSAAACHPRASVIGDHVSPCSAAETGKAGIRACREAIVRTPGDPALHTRLAASLVAVNKFEEARAELEHALRLDTENFEAHYGMGLVLNATGHYDKALTHFERALAIDETHAETRWHIGFVLRKLGRQSEALAAFRELARREPTAASAWSWMAICAAELQNHTLAVSYWQRAIQMDITYFDRAQATERALFEESLKIAGPQPAAVLESADVRPAPRTP